MERSDEPLWHSHDLVMLDLDGVVYVGPDAVPGAPGHLRRAREAGLRLAFVTNNASRTPDTVAAHLRDLGVEAQADDVVTSAQAAARVLVERCGVGARVVLVGATGLREAVQDQGLIAVGVAEAEDAGALVTGYGPEVLWGDIMRAAVLVRDGLWWVASNTDMTIPTAYGTAPGHGVLVETVRRFAGVDPVVAGKPARPLLDETVRRVGGERPLMVGDRLDTDIAGAQNAGVASLLVLTGISGLPELVAARPEERPSYLAPDLAGLGEPHPVPEERDRGAELGGWRAEVESDALRVTGGGSDADWWRVVAAAGWSHLDQSGRVAEIAHLTAPGH